MTELPAPNQRVSTRATGIVGIAILCSRILGLLREVIFASLFGASRNMDAFLTAFRAPNMLRDLFAEGALSTAFVTTFSRRIATDGDDSAWRLASKVATLTLVFMSALTVLEAEYARGRSKLDSRTQQRWDRAVSRARVKLADASAAAGGDVNARLRVLDGYAAAMRSLGRAIEETEEATR